MTKKMYLAFIKKTLATEGVDVADTANKLALELRAITIEQYSKASRLIVKYFLRVAQ